MMRLILLLGALAGATWGMETFMGWVLFLPTKITTNNSWRAKLIMMGRPYPKDTLAAFSLCWPGDGDVSGCRLEGMAEHASHPHLRSGSLCAPPCCLSWTPSCKLPLPLIQQQQQQLLSFDGSRSSRTPTQRKLGEVCDLDWDHSAVRRGRTNPFPHNSFVPNCSSEAAVISRKWAPAISCPQNFHLDGPTTVALQATRWQLPLSQGAVNMTWMWHGVSVHVFLPVMDLWMQGVILTPTQFSCKKKGPGLLICPPQHFGS